MKTSVNEYDFRRWFEQTRPENFSYQGLGALFEYLEQLEEDLGEDIEFDGIAICCDYQELESLEEFNSDYSKECEDLDDVAEYTTVIPVEGTDRFIIQVF